MDGSWTLTRVQHSPAHFLSQSQPQKQSVAPRRGLVGLTHAVTLRAEDQVRLHASTKLSAPCRHR